MGKHSRRNKNRTLAAGGSNYDEARARYRPHHIKTLFVAEAPPADPSRFFYFENVTAHDWLFLALIRWHYVDARDLETDELRERKSEFLARFRNDGYYLSYCLT